MKRIKKLFGKTDHNVSYAQCGEDLIINYIFQALGFRQISYFDIGAYHPTHYSNTYLFYRRGCRGICIEPNPILAKDIRKKRERDVCLNIGVGITESSEADFFIMSAKTLSTFSKDDAERYVNYGKQKIVEIIRVPLLPLQNILEQYCPNVPYFISLDTEGFDLAILQHLNYSRFRPQVFCVETLTYAEDNTGVKITTIIDVMGNNDYFVYADTYINTIFVDKETWFKRQ